MVVFPTAGTGFAARDSQLGLPIRATGGFVAFQGCKSQLETPTPLPSFGVGLQDLLVLKDLGVNKPDQSHLEGREPSVTYPPLDRLLVTALNLCGLLYRDGASEVENFSTDHNVLPKENAVSNRLTALNRGRRFDLGI